jgi:hypothetical protein
MTTDAITAIIGASSSLIVAVTALLLNYRGFAAIDGRFAAASQQAAEIWHKSTQGQMPS